MANFKPVRQLLNKNIDNKRKNLNIDNSIDIGRYAIKKGFVPGTKKASTAYDIAKSLSDLKNYAFYFSAVNKLSPQIARQLLSETLDDIKRGEEMGKPIRNPAAVYNWKVQKALKRKK